MKNQGGRAGDLHKKALHAMNGYDAGGDVGEDAVLSDQEQSDLSPSGGLQQPEQMSGATDPMFASEGDQDAAVDNGNAQNAQGSSSGGGFSSFMKSLLGSGGGGMGKGNAGAASRFGGNSRSNVGMGGGAGQQWLQPSYSGGGIIGSAESLAPMALAMLNKGGKARAYR